MPFPKKLTTIVNLGVHYLSMLSPRSANVFVFGAWQGRTFSDNPKYLYLQARRDKKITAVWITRDENICRQLQAAGMKAYMYHSLPGIYYQLRAKVYFTCMSKLDVETLLLGNAVRINLWHGVGLKKIMADDQINKRPTRKKAGKGARMLQKMQAYPRRREYIVSTSNTMTDIFARAFKKDRRFVLQMGQPRNDVFFDGGLEFEKFPYKGMAGRTILYMPTHRDGGKKSMALSTLFDLKKLNDFCRQNDCLFLVKKHYYHGNEQEDLSAFPNIVDITNQHFDAQLLLKNADLLITDYSSCYVDYLLLDRPVVFYNFDHADYVLNDRDLYFDYDETTPGAKAQSFDELITALQQVLAGGEDPYKSQRHQVRDLFYAPDNQRVVGTKILDFAKAQA